MIYTLLFLFLNIGAQEHLWQTARTYEESLNNSKKIPFYSQEEWKNLSLEDQNTIRTVLVFKHAEIRYAPLHMLRLKLFNSYVGSLNADLWPLKKNGVLISPLVPINPLYYWKIYVDDKFLTKPGDGYYEYLCANDGSHTDNIRSDIFPLTIPYIETHIEERNKYTLKTLESYTWNENVLTIGGSSCYLPLKNVHSICTLENSNPYLEIVNNPNRSAGLLITLKNGMQVMWNRNENLLLPVGFCKQYNRDIYTYCNNLHDSLYKLKKPSQILGRFSFSHFIWDTPQKWYWDYKKSRVYSALTILFMTGGMYLFLKCLWNYGEEQAQIERAKNLVALTNFERELADKNIIFPQRLREQIRL